ncbi:MAG: ABC transporter transmembrane domain-containing protein, partial [Candidatus Bathyarchaeota archaeon]|nr:ABC transporter transmembrane domain-containing protein [Candidatus Bathyarchaeota archaeon]
MKSRLKKYFESLYYYYSYTGYRVFVIVILSILVGILDGFGLAMFLPLLKMVNNAENLNPDNLGPLKILVELFFDLDIPLNLLMILILMLIVFFLKGVAQYYAGIYKVYVLQDFIKKLRLQSISNLNNLSYRFFVSSDIGRIQNTLTGEVDRIAVSFTNYFRAIQYAVMVIVFMVFAFTLNAQFALLVSIGGGLTNFLYKRLYRSTKGASIKLTGENNLFQGLIIQNVANFKYLKATGSIKDYEKKLKDSVLKIQSS